jgi:hypothetical protein
VDYVEREDVNDLPYKQSAIEVAEHCPNLTRFDGVGYHDNDVLSRLARCCPQLEELVGFEQCTNEVVLELSRCCKKLKRVHLMCRDLDEPCLTALVRSNPGLANLRLRAEGVTDSFLSTLTDSCRNLEELYLEESVLQGNSLQLVLKQCQELRSLTLYWCVISDDGTVPARGTNDRMRTLVLDHTDIPKIVIKHLLRACEGLIRLTLKDMEESLGRGGLDLSTVRLSNLEEFTLRGGVRSYPDLMLYDLADHCHDELRVLDIGNTVDIDSEDILTMPLWWKNLERVNLAGCWAVTDDFLKVLAYRCDELCALDVSGCVNISMRGIRAVKEGCRKLVELNVEGCPYLDSDDESNEDSAFSD